MPGDFHALYEGAIHDGAVQGRGVPARPMPVRGVRDDVGARRLAVDVPGLVVAYDEVTGAPTQLTVRAAGVRLAPGAATPEDAAIRFVRSRADLWRMGTDDVDTVRVVSVSRRGLRTVRLLQEVAGVEVFNSDVTVAMNADNEVFAVAGQLFPGAGAAIDQARDLGRSDATAAIVRAAADLTGRAFDEVDFELAGPSGHGPYRAYRHRPRAGERQPDEQHPVPQAVAVPAMSSDPAAVTRTATRAAGRPLHRRAAGWAT